MKLLLIDDDINLSRVLAYQLQKNGFLVSTAKNGDEGLSLFFKESFDIIITDKNMPNMGGVKLLKSVRKIDPDVKVVLITGFGGKQSYINAMGLGAVEFLHKPLRIGDLKKFISNLIK